MQTDTLQDGYKVIDTNNPDIVAALREDIQFGNANADELHKCEAVAVPAGKDQRCNLGVQPPPRRVNGQPVGR
jgi:hypothetical protein